MKRVVLLVTGQTEVALAPSLKQVFPDVDFTVRPPRMGFTSMPLRPTPMLKRLGTAKHDTHIEKLVELLVAEIEPGRGHKPPDLVVLVDDLELFNVDWHERAVEHVRVAVQAYIKEFSWPSNTSKERAIERLRERCSFHLLCPMVESYFFAESAALKRAGATRASAFDATATDAEQFQVDEPDFLNPPDRFNKDSLPKWATADRAKHPKRYLQFLCDPAGTSQRPYIEADNVQGRPSGEAALRSLDWSMVFAQDKYVQFIRSLIHDLADALHEPAVKARFAGVTHRLTWPPPANNVLRNV